ncbi:hypothetical protein YA0002_24380 [Pseudomonas cichorii]|uniref:hypothetical protein n=1 Tax=Pseudomonas cichorii TaxID=36746 RepID=UPI0018E61AEC|nr:hypothetical protein [Pseudomonas cichorii]MBI6855906.1 hypothetical protein [Pseudomonas cichorii]
MSDSVEFERAVTVIYGIDAATSLACRLLLESAFYEVTPLPHDEYKFEIKIDRKELLNIIPAITKGTTTAEITILLRYADSFDYEDLSEVFWRVISDAKDKGKLDLPGSENSEHEGVRIECSSVEHIFANWHN